jgi:hypothetical protein
MKILAVVIVKVLWSAGPVGTVRALSLHSPADAPSRVKAMTPRVCHGAQSGIAPRLVLTSLPLHHHHHHHFFSTCPIISSRPFPTMTSRRRTSSATASATNADIPSLFSVPIATLALLSLSALPLARASCDPRYDYK